MVGSCFFKYAMLQKQCSLFLESCAISLETIVTWNEISTLSVYGLPHSVGPPSVALYRGKCFTLQKQWPVWNSGASWGVFVGRRSRRWESDREQAESLFPSVMVSSAAGQGICSSIPGRWHVQYGHVKLVLCCKWMRTLSVSCCTTELNLEAKIIRFLMHKGDISFLND